MKSRKWFYILDHNKKFLLTKKQQNKKKTKTNPAQLISVFNMITTFSYVTLLTAALFLYGLGLSLHRLYLSPLAKFPGPRLAAITHWYQRYFDLVAGGTGGQFLWEIRRMHEKYGPIVRITPDELHIDDPDYWNEIYCNSTTVKPIDKQAKLQHRFGVPDAIFSTPKAEHHRQRRGALAPFFSKQRLREANGRVSSLMERISVRLSTEFAGTGRVLNVGNMFSCFAVDVVTELAFDRCTNCLDAPEFMAPLVGVTTKMLWTSHWNAHFSFLQQWMSYMPSRLLDALLPIYQPIFQLRADINQQVAEILLESEKLQSSSRTMFNDLLSSHLPPHELSMDRITQDAFALISAGMETTKSTLTMGVFHILKQPSIHERLKAELTDAMPDPTLILPWVDLEKLPYLTAVIYESEWHMHNCMVDLHMLTWDIGLRLSYGSVQRSPRINRLHAWEYGNWVIPAGTAVGMDSYHMHSNAEIFPEPFVFRPERWLDSPRGPDGRQPLISYLSSFGGGSRVCIAMNLAYMELYIALATMFRRHNFQLFETDSADVEFALEMLAPMPRWESRGVRVTVEQ